MSLKQYSTSVARAMAHKAAHQICYIGHKKFVKALSHPEKAQRKILKNLLVQAKDTAFYENMGMNTSMCYEELREILPPTYYENWRERINKQKKFGNKEINSACSRYQPTSGSTSDIKWIPYTNSLLNEFDRAASPWIYDIGKQVDHFLEGKHYWSLSWLPTHLRNEVHMNANDDLALLPWWKRKFMGLTMAMPCELSLAPTSESAMMGTLVYLVNSRDLTLMSIWSPTFALNLFQELSIHRKELSRMFSRGSWGKWRRDLKHIPMPKSSAVASLLKSWDGTICAEFFQQLWPKLKLVSSWDTSTSVIWAEELQKLLPHANFQGKGLWATEGVVTIPFEGAYPLAITSHFYEFVDLKNRRIYPSWELNIGQEVQPMLTTGSGFWRYLLKDKLRVTGFNRDCPCFEFLGRIGEVDMVGEKLSPDKAQEVLNYVDKNFNVRPLSLMAITGKTHSQSKPYYTLLCEGNDAKEIKEISKVTEKILNEAFHYKLAREINQLAPAKAVVNESARAIYQREAAEKGMIIGNLKIEPITLRTELKIKEDK